MIYKFTINQGDVRPESCPALEAYRAKRLQWIGWLDEDPDHAIQTAISSMVWTDVSFRTLAQLALKPYNLAPADGGDARQRLAEGRCVNKMGGPFA
jgi:hypothetical protein